MLFNLHVLKATIQTIKNSIDYLNSIHQITSHRYLAVNRMFRRFLLYQAVGAKLDHEENSCNSFNENFENMISQQSIFSKPANLTENNEGVHAWIGCLKNFQKKPVPRDTDFKDVISQPFIRKERTVVVARYFLSIDIAERKEISISQVLDENVYTAKAKVYLRSA